MTKLHLSHYIPNSNHFLNRRMEMQAIRDAWNSKNTDIVYLYGVGGIGKTSIVSAWLKEYESSNLQDADFIFVWSFYASHSYRDFLIELANFILGNKGLTELAEEELLHCIAKRLSISKYVLVLDGLEEIDRESNSNHQFDSVNKLLNVLARNDGGLVIVTSRSAPLPDTLNTATWNLKVIHVQPLTVSDASSFLKAFLPEISETDAAKAVQVLGGHPLAISVLAQYIESTRGKNVRSISDIVENIGKESLESNNQSLYVLVEPGQANEEDVEALESALTNLSDNLKLNVLSSK